MKESLLNLLNRKMDWLYGMYSETSPMYEEIRKDCNDIIYACYESGCTTEEIEASIKKHNPNAKYKIKVTVL